MDVWVHLITLLARLLRFNIKNTEDTKSEFVGHTFLRALRQAGTSYGQQKVLSLQRGLGGAISLVTADRQLTGLYNRQGNGQASNSHGHRYVSRTRNWP